MAQVPRSFEGFYGLILHDQFIHICSQDLRLFLKDPIPDNLKKIAYLADKFQDAKKIRVFQAVDKVTCSRVLLHRKPRQPK